MRMVAYKFGSYFRTGSMTVNHSIPSLTFLLLMQLYRTTRDWLVWGVDRALPKVERRAFLWIWALAVLVRLPFWFTSTDGYVRDAAVTLHDEGVMMQLGLDVLRGHVPYMHHWDSVPLLGWPLMALLMALSLGFLTLFRFWATVWLAAIGYVVFRTLADMNKRTEARWAAGFCVVFGSTLQGGQSFLWEHVAALPLSVLVYYALHPRHNWRSARKLLLWFTAAGLAAMNSLMLAPALAVLCRGLYNPARRAGFKGAVLTVAWPVVVRCSMLVSAVVLAQMALYAPYLLFGYGDVFLHSLLQTPRLLVGAQLKGSADFFWPYLMKLQASTQWLVAFAALVFVVKFFTLLLRGRAARLMGALALLMASALLMVAMRGNHGSLFLFYFVQVMPIFALVMGLAMRFDYDEAKGFVIGAVVIGLHQALWPVSSQYVSLAKFMGGDNREYASLYGDRLYRTAKLMQTFPTKGEWLVVCGEDDMLYLLTGMKNPRYFLFPFHHYNWDLHHMVGMMPVPTLRDRVQHTKPLYIVGRDNDPLTRKGFGEIADIMQQRYIQVGNVDGTLVYIRRDALNNIFR